MARQGVTQKMAGYGLLMVELNHFTSKCVFMPCKPGKIRTIVCVLTERRGKGKFSCDRNSTSLLLELLLRIIMK